jgi:hypothetical protein
MWTDHWFSYPGAEEGGKVVTVYVNMKAMESVSFVGDELARIFPAGTDEENRQGWFEVKDHVSIEALRAWLGGG